MRVTRGDLYVSAFAALAALAATIAEGAPAAVVAATVIAGAALALTRSRPLVASFVAAACFVAVAPLTTALTGAGFALLAVHAFRLARWAPRTPAIAGAIALAAAAIPSDSPVPILLAAAAPWGAGRALREHEVVAARLAERARELEAEREAYAQLAVRYERARIASELHDIVAHAISVMVVQVGAGQRLAAIDPALTAEAFEAIADSARQAQDDLGALVDLLSRDDAIAAAPDLALVEELVNRASRTGLDVTLRLEGEREGLSSPSVQTAYRVVQESLTNALRYASGAAVRVLVRGDADDLVVEVENAAAPRDADLADHGTGNGLRGLRERLSACGGTLEAGPNGDGGWKVRARVPRRAAAAA